MSSARCIAAFRTNSEVCSWTRFAARWMRSKVAFSARSSMRFVLTATATPPSSLSHLCSQLSITSLYGECTYTASEGCGQHWGPPGDHTSCAMPNDLHVVNVTHHALAAKTAGDLGKRTTATSWGSSGRRFKSCQPDLQK